MSVAKLLKEETLFEHQQAESVLIPQLEKISSKNQYCSLLKRFYGFYKPLQERSLQLLDPEVLPDRNTRNTSALILKDLKHLGCGIENIPLSVTLPDIRSEAEAMGALYVIEGSSLGGKIIRRMLLSNSSLNIDEESVNFFNGYGDETGPKWLGFLKALETQTDSEAVLHSAKKSFRVFTEWISAT